MESIGEAEAHGAELRLHRGFWGKETIFFVDDGIRIRDFTPTELDYEAVASINALASHEEYLSFEPQTAPELRGFDNVFDPASFTLRRFIAEAPLQGTVAGYGFYAHMPWCFDPGKYWGSIRCNPSFRRRGIGTRIYDHMLSDLSRKGASAVRMSAREKDDVGCGFLRRRGFDEVMRSLEFELKTEHFGFSAFEEDELRTLNEGVRVLALPRLMERDPAWFQKLYALHVAITRDIPIPDEPNPEMQPERFRSYLLHHKDALLEGSFVAVSGDDYVGECLLQRHDGDAEALYHDTTGVLRAYRGKGVAMALKLQAIRFAKEGGFRRLVTWVEDNNAPMLSINKKLGFRHRSGFIVYEKKLAM